MELAASTLELQVSRSEGRLRWRSNSLAETLRDSLAETLGDRILALVSAPYKHLKRGKYKIAVKVIDIFGNDTTKVVEVNV